MSRPCPLCQPPPEHVVREFDLVRVLIDGHPVADGHLLVVTGRHVGSFFDATAQERHAITDALAWAKAYIDELQKPSSYTVGINDGPAAGQSVPHCHVHLIPRQVGDVVEPRGGVRWVLPERAAYWER